MAHREDQELLVQVSEVGPSIRLSSVRAGACPQERLVDDSWRECSAGPGISVRNRRLHWSKVLCGVVAFNYSTPIETLGREVESRSPWGSSKDCEHEGLDRRLGRDSGH